MASCAKWLPRLQIQNLATGREQALHGALVLAAGGAVEAARQPQGQRGGRFGFQRQVGQHVFHERLVDQLFAEGAALRGVV